MGRIENVKVKTIPTIANSLCKGLEVAMYHDIWKTREQHGDTHWGTKVADWCIH